MENYKTEIVRLVNALNNDTALGQIPNEVRKIDAAIQSAWDTWDDDIVATFYNHEKPARPTMSFIYQWVENEDLEQAGFDMDVLRGL